MFRNRRNSQKPDDELIQKFQRTFSDVIPGATEHNGSADQGSIELVNRSRPHSGFNDMKSNEQTRRNTPDLRLSSPFIDPNSLGFLSFANQSQNLFTPNSTGFNGGFHSQHAGDLHTPMGLNMMNPLTFSNQLAGTAPMDADATAMGLNQFGQQFFSSPFQSTQPFAQQPSFAPSAFHHDSAYDAMDESIENSSLNELELQEPSTKMPTSTMEMTSQGGYKNGESGFRYNTTLRAPTAMIRSPRDIPITYLNKGQAYSLSVADSNPPLMDSKMLRYRTFIRVTFQDEEQRVKSGACWQLWKEGRGSSEAHQRNGKIQAVEYVDPFQGGNEDRKGRQVQVESTSIDGFCVTWTANPNTGASECTIPVRFNFLSTDFSHSKGVKGIPVRLCAKTQLVSSVDGAGADQEAELSFCQVKLFRDHGAERKLSNDVAHVKKTIEKLKQQIVQAEMGGGNNGKRKRTNASVAFNGADHRPPKISKHKRTWSMDSRDDADRVSLEDDLHAKLAVMQEMFSSTCPVSSLNMQGNKQDDPDLFPVQLPNDDAQSSLPSKRSDLRALRGNGPNFDETMPSPVISSPRPLISQPTNADSGYQTSLSSRGSSLPGSEFSLSHPVKVQRINSEPSASTGYIEAMDIDPTYRPPAERRVKPIACFYLRFPHNEAQKDDYYRAVYLSERSVRDLMDKISVKRSIDSKRVVRVLLVKKDGLKVMVDDDVVRELPDGQDMDVEISETADSSESPDDSRPPAIEVKLSY